MNEGSKFKVGEIVKVVGNCYGHILPIWSYARVDFISDEFPEDYLVFELQPSSLDRVCISQIISEDCLEKVDSLVDRLKIRAIIRRQAQDRKSVQEGKSDRLADLLDEAAKRIELLENVCYEGY